MQSAEIEDRVREILTNRLGIPAAEITAEAKLVDDLGMDSLDAVELAIAVERHFGVGLSDESVAQLSTVSDVTGVIRKLLDEQGSAV
jgi:acyl carrier protein